MQLHHQEREHRQNHQRKTSRDRSATFGTFFHSTTHFNPKAGWQFGTQLLQARRDLRCNRGRLHIGAVDVASHGDGRHAVAPPNHAFFKFVFHTGDLR